MMNNSGPNTVLSGEIQQTELSAGQHQPQKTENRNRRSTPAVHLSAGTDASSEQQGCYRNGLEMRWMLNFGIIYYTKEHDYAFKVHGNSTH